MELGKLAEQLVPPKWLKSEAAWGRGCHLRPLPRELHGLSGWGLG